MIMNADELPEQDEIEMLLPWYVTGKLDGDDLKRVEAYLERHPDMRARLELSMAERHETVFLNEPVTSPSASTVDRFMAQISRAPAGWTQSDLTRESWIDKLKRSAKRWAEPFFESPALQWGGALAGLVILLQAVAIVAMMSSSPGTVYQTASGEKHTVPAGTYVDVRFSDGASVAKMAAALSEMNMTIAGGPKAGGFFMVRIGPETMSAAERERLIAALKKRTDIVMFVTGTK